MSSFFILHLITKWALLHYYVCSIWGLSVLCCDIILPMTYHPMFSTLAHFFHCTYTNINQQ